MFKKRKIKTAQYLSKLKSDLDAFSNCRSALPFSSNPFFDKVLDYVDLCCMEGETRTQECIELLNNPMDESSLELNPELLANHCDVILQANELALVKINLLLSCASSPEFFSSVDLKELKRALLEYSDVESRCLHFYSSPNYLARHVEMIKDIFDDSATHIRKFFVFDKAHSIDMPKNEEQKKLEEYLAVFDMFDHIIDLNEDFVERYKDMKTLSDDGYTFTRKVITYNMLVAEKIVEFNEHIIDSYGDFFAEKPTLATLDVGKLAELKKIFSDTISLNQSAIMRLEIACEADLNGFNSSDFVPYRTEIMGMLHTEAKIFDKYLHCGENYLKREEKLLSQLCNPDYPNLCDWKVIDHTKEGL